MGMAIGGLLGLVLLVALVVYSLRVSGRRRASATEQTASNAWLAAWRAPFMPRNRRR